MHCRGDRYIRANIFDALGEISLEQMLLIIVIITRADDVGNILSGMEYTRYLLFDRYKNKDYISSCQ